MTPRRSIHAAIAILTILATPLCVRAQPSPPRGGNVTIRGQVTDKEGRALQGVTLMIDTQHGATSNAEGWFIIGDLAPGTYVVHSRFVGYAADSVIVTVADGAVGRAKLQLSTAATSLSAVRVEAARLTGQALSLNRQLVAENLISVSTNEEILALPNQNAADAFSRLPGVSLQRHEGEGASVQVRGIDGNLTNVTINGAHMSGKSEDNTGGDRRVYLDGIPAALVGAVQLNKTLTPDMDADAVGGSLSIETPSADLAPGLRLQGTYGQSDLSAANVWLGSASFGKRYNNNTSFFIGLSQDHNTRVYDDNEPTYTRIKLASGDSATLPTGTSAREYRTDRMREGLTGRLDFSPTDNTTLTISGIYSHFHDYGIRPRQDHTLKASGVTPIDALHGTATGIATTSDIQTRTPTDQTGMFGIKGTTIFGANVLDYSTTYSKDTYQRVDGVEANFSQGGLTGTYDWSNPNYPEIVATGGYTDPTKFTFKKVAVTNENSLGQDYAAQVNFTMPMTAGTFPASFKFGAKFRNETKEYNNQIYNYLPAPGQTFGLSNDLGTFTDPNHYYGHYPIAFTPDPTIADNTVRNGTVLTVDPTTVLAGQLASFTGAERIISQYVSYSLDVHAAHFLFGVRAEETNVSYNAWGSVVGSATAVQPLNGGQSYANFFPNAQLRYQLDPSTNLRVAVTTSMARPLYSQIAPTVTLNNNVLPTDPNAISAGNPNLKPMTATNEDVMLERFLPGVGLISAGVFAKQIQNYIFNENFTYASAPYAGYNGTRPTNAKNGSLEGVEAAWQQRFTSLPGALGGLGLDANAVWTHSNTSTPTRPSMNLPRQADWNYNIAGTYAASIVTARVTVQYNGPYIYKVGDGTPNPSTGDTFMMPHTQIDASLNVAVNDNTQLVLQGLNLNNAPFGYYTGTSLTYIQKEYYGKTATLAVRYRL